MSPTGAIMQQMGHITGTGWQSLKLLGSILDGEAPHPSVDSTRVLQHLTDTRSLMDEVASDSSLASDLRTYILDRLREVEDALIDATIKGTPAVERARNALWGTRAYEPDWWDRISQTKWAPRIGIVWAAIVTTLGATGGVPALMPGVDLPPQIENTVIVQQSDNAQNDVVDGEIIEDEHEK